MSKILYNSPIIKIPDEFAIFTKNNKVKVVKPLKNNNLKTIKKKKPIQIIEDKDIDKIIIESQGRKIDIDNNDLGLKKIMKEKKPRKQREKIIKKNINKEEIKKIQDIEQIPIIIKKTIKPKKSKIDIIKKDYYIESSLNEKENEKLQKDLIELKKKNITPSRLEEFLRDHNLKPIKSTMDEWYKYRENFIKNHKINYGFNK
jgi:hypothetical protein